MSEPRNPEPLAPTTTDYDHLDKTLSRDEVWAAYADMRERCPVAHNSRYGGHLHVLRYDEVREMAARSEDFSSAHGGFIPPTGLRRMAPIDYDGDQHALWRALMQAPLTPAAVRELKPALDDVIDGHIDAFAGVGTAELFSALAEPVPAHVVGRVVGLSPQDCVTLREVAIATSRAIGTDEFETSKVALDDFIRAQIAQRRTAPCGDYLSQLAMRSSVCWSPC